MSTRPYVPLFAAVRTSRKLAQLDDASERLYSRLLTQCDDWGRCERDARMVMADCWPLLGKSVEETERCLVALEAAGLIESRSLDGLEWIQVPDWEDKGGSVGKVDHRKASRWPDDGPALARVRPALARSWPVDGPAPSDDGPALARSGPRARAETETETKTESKTKNLASPPASAESESVGRTPSEAQEVWAEAWKRHRPGADPWVFTGKECATLNKAAADRGLEPLRIRVEALLSDESEQFRAHASPMLVVKHWSNLGLAKVPKASKSAPDASGGETAWRSVQKAVAHWAQRQDAPDMPGFKDPKCAPALAAIGGFRQFLGGIQADRVEWERRRFLGAYERVGEVAAAPATAGGVA